LVSPFAGRRCSTVGRTRCEPRGVGPELGGPATSALIPGQAAFGAPPPTARRKRPWQSGPPRWSAADGIAVPLADHYAFGAAVRSGGLVEGTDFPTGPRGPAAIRWLALGTVCRSLFAAGFEDGNRRRTGGRGRSSRVARRAGAQTSSPTGPTRRRIGLGRARLRGQVRDWVRGAKRCATPFCSEVVRPLHVRVWYAPGLPGIRAQGSPVAWWPPGAVWAVAGGQGGTGCWGRARSNTVRPCPAAAVRIAPPRAWGIRPRPPPWSGSASVMRHRSGDAPAIVTVTRRFPMPAHRPTRTYPRSVGGPSSRGRS